jgi:RimJ/RimL family protein N-acetyltransferase
MYGKGVFIRVGETLDYSDLNTERFTLKALTPEMVGAEYLSWFYESGVLDRIAYAKNEVTIAGLKEYVKTKLESKEVLFLGIFLHDNLKHIGNIKFEPIDFEKQYAVLGVLIGNNDWRGRGVFSEISKEIEKSLRNKKIKNIYLGVEKDNFAAIKAYEKEGYQVCSENFLKTDLTIAHCMRKEI